MAVPKAIWTVMKTALEPAGAAAPAVPIAATGADPVTVYLAG